MTKKQLKNRLKILFQQLELMNIYPDNFQDKLGKRGIQNYIDDILDEINEINDLLDLMSRKTLYFERMRVRQYIYVLF